VSITCRSGQVRSGQVSSRLFAALVIGFVFARFAFTIATSRKVVALVVEHVALRLFCARNTQQQNQPVSVLVLSLS
jgi:hypothetical protein